VAHLTFPNDVQVAGVDEHPYRHVAPGTPAPSLPAVSPRLLQPDPHQLRVAAQVLNAAARPAILVGAGALHAREQVLAVADRLGAPIVKTLPGKAMVPDDHPLTTGWDRAAGYQAQRGADGGVRHAAHGRNLVSVRQVPTIWAAHVQQLLQTCFVRRRQGKGVGLPAVSTGHARERATERSERGLARPGARSVVAGCGLLRDLSAVVR
jgi:thiamine pyrophosphate-dependent enzyme